MAIATLVYPLLVSMTFRLLMFMFASRSFAATFASSPGWSSSFSTMPSYVMMSKSASLSDSIAFWCWSVVSMTIPRSPHPSTVIRSMFMPFSARVSLMFATTPTSSFIDMTICFILVFP